MGKIKLSFSTFTNYSQCPLRVLLLKSHIIEEQPLFMEQAVGLYAHAFLEDAVSQAYGRPPIDHWAFLDDGRELLFTKEEYKSFIVDNYGEMIHNSKEPLLELLKDDGIIDVEIEKEYEAKERNYIIVGRADIIGYTGDGVIVYDVKRSNSNRYDDKQLSLYAYLLSRNGINVKRLKFVFIRKKMVITDFAVNDKSIGLVKKTLNEIAKAFSKEDYSKFKPNVTSWTCSANRCAAFSVCPYGALKGIEVRMTDDELVNDNEMVEV